MKTSQMIPAWVLFLLTPMMALAAAGSPADSERVDQYVSQSPGLWYWVAVLVVAAAAFAVVSFRLSKRRQPPHRPSTP
jgi:tellurite resistance protein TehA-like permease